MSPRYLAHRLLACLPIVLGVTLVCFALVYLGPVDPVSAVTPDDATADQIAAIRVLYGFDKPLPVQYLSWLCRLVTGDLGASIQTGRPVVELLLPALLNTIRLAVVATGLGFSVAFVFGVTAASWRGTWVDRLLAALSSIAISIPSYWLGIVLVVLFSVERNWLPAMGMGPGGGEEWAWDAEHVRYLVLPAIALSVIPAGVIARTTRAAVLETLGQEYVEALQARGLPPWRILITVLRNAAPTVLAVCGLQFGPMLGGSILIETIFAWPGSGLLLFQSIFKRDLPVLQGAILVIAMMFVLINLTADILQGWLDPRIERR
jgi:peptide/nickel transport system permease protein